MSKMMMMKKKSQRLNKSKLRIKKMTLIKRKKMKNQMVIQTKTQMMKSKLSDPFS
jgi:hypothetical protein